MGGNNELSNLNLCDPNINRMKWTISKEDFVELCKRVANHNS